MTIKKGKLTSQKSRISQPSWHRSLVVTALLIGGNFHWIHPVLAEGTEAGTQVNNKATAIYNPLVSLS